VSFRESGNPEPPSVRPSLDVRFRGHDTGVSEDLSEIFSREPVCLFIRRSIVRRPAPRREALGAIAGSGRDACSRPDRKFRHDHIGQRALQVTEQFRIVSVDRVPYQDSFDCEFVDSTQGSFPTFNISKHSETKPNSACHCDLTDIQRGSQIDQVHSFHNCRASALVCRDLRANRKTKSTRSFQRIKLALLLLLALPITRAILLFFAVTAALLVLRNNYCGE
jgi:hypothetical protein